MNSRRTNGRRRFVIDPLRVMAGRAHGYGYAPLPPEQALATWQWMAKRMIRWWKQKGWKAGDRATGFSGTLFDMTRTGGGIGHCGFPVIDMESNDSLADSLSGIFGQWLHEKSLGGRFLREGLGMERIDTPLTVDVRCAGVWPFQFLPHLHGVRLKKSENSFHKGAVWLHGAGLYLNRDATRWMVKIEYAYRIDTSSWQIEIVQDAGESVEVFGERVWRWLDERIEWRHPDRYYVGIGGGDRPRKWDELKWAACAERDMMKLRDNLRDGFGWGPGLDEPAWYDRVAEGLMREKRDGSGGSGKIEMTSERLKELKRWMRADRVRYRKVERARQAKRNGGMA